jgi:IS4 transposase
LHTLNRDWLEVVANLLLGRLAMTIPDPDRARIVSIDFIDNSYYGKHYADDGYRLYITNLPSGEFSPKQVATLYRARWVVELLFRELKSKYGLGRYQTEKEHIVRIQVTAALLTLVVSRAILRLFMNHAHEQGDDCVFPTERWATTPVVHPASPLGDRRSLQLQPEPPANT